MIKSDFHTHSHFSSDSKAAIPDMIEKAALLGMDNICITDHMDYDYPKESGLSFVFDPDEYFAELQPIADRYLSKIKVLKGIELGLQPYLAERYNQLLQQYDFDFIIGSSHLAEGKDPYSPWYWEGKTTEEGIQTYFQSIIDNVKAFSGFQVYGHLDYIIRYIPDKSYVFTYEKYADYIDEALKTIILSGKGIEANTSGYKYGFGTTHPNMDILKRYRELGGEMITIGSDGHKPEHLGYDFTEAEQMLLALGFQYYTTFEKQKPIYHKLG